MASVLLAEDEFLIRAALVDALEGLGLACIEAANGQTALDVVTGQEPLAAIIVDIGLPDMSGDKVIEAGIRHRPQITVIRCSGTPPATPLPAGGRVHVVAKPYSVDELSKLVASLVAKKGG
jgi:CheY-like chemotaxis protein